MFAFTRDHKPHQAVRSRKVSCAHERVMVVVVDVGNLCYWQELIESILWSHHKLKVVPQIQPRALSISQGRAVGVSHYILGGIGCTFTFFLARMSSLS